MQKVQIYSSASYLPLDTIKSDDLFTEIKSDQQYDIPIDWMSQDMGVKERRYSPSNTPPSTLAVYAAEKAILKSGVSYSDIEMVIFCGIERDQPEPATAHTIANKLGINAKRTFDVSNACFGFIDGLEIASNFISSGKINNALIVTAEVFSEPVSHLIDDLKCGMPANKAKKCIGFLSLGDAGGAVVLGESKNGVTGFDHFNTHTLSDEVKRCHYKISESGNFNGQMQMAHLSALMIKGHTQILDETLDNLGWDQFDFLISHQIGEKPYERLSELGGANSQQLDRDSIKHVKTYDYLGNIASATFPINFEKLSELESVKAGSRVGGMFAGSGLVYGQIGYTI